MSEINYKGKVITFDIWDTLIKRKCNPEEVKLYTANNYLENNYDRIKEEYLNAIVLHKKRVEIEEKYYSKAKEGDDPECNIEDVLYSWVEETIDLDKISLDSKSFIKTLSNKLLNEEVEREIAVTYPNPLISEYLEKFKDNKKYCISDFYIGKKYLSKILEANDMLKHFEKLYISCDVGKTKRAEGHLFEYFSEKEKIDFKDMIHLGDNVYSDVECANKLGITAIQIENERIYNYDQDGYGCLLDIEAKVNESKREISSEELNCDDLTKQKNMLYNLGLDYSYLGYFFVYDLILDAHRKGYSTIYYQTREGENFIKYHNIIKENNPFPFKVPDGKLLEVSRVSTFSASMKEFSIPELLKMWSQYRSQSFKALYKSLNIDYVPYMEYFEKYNIDVDTVIHEPWFNINVQNLFEDEKYIQEMNKEIKKKQDDLLAYLKTIGITKETEKMYIVDVGWRGTIQDNIAALLENTQVDGAYIALFDFYNAQRKNVSKYDFLSDKNFNYTFVAPTLTIFEMFFNPPSGSVIGYNNGVALRKAKTEELEFVKNVTSNIQAGIEDGAKIINDIIKYRSTSRDSYIKYVNELLKRTKITPQKILVRTLYSLIHNDTFGTGEYLHKKQTLPLSKRLNPFYIRKAERNEEWLEGFETVNDLKFYNFLRRGKNKLKRMIKAAFHR